MGFSWELPTHVRRKKKGDEDVVEGEEAVPVPVKVKAAKKEQVEVLGEVIPSALSGVSASKWPHEVYFYFLSTNCNLLHAFVT